MALRSLILAAKQPCTIDNPAGKPDVCRPCSLYASQEGIVWGVGPQDARVFAVGEAPGEEEGQCLEPFIGGSGRVFSALCAHAQLDRRDMFVTNAVKCRPTARGADGRIINRAPTDVEIRCCAHWMKAELERVNPNVVIPLGNVPLRLLTGSTKGISLMRSVPLEGSKRPDGTRYKILPTFHPAFVMRRQDFWPMAVYDLHRAKQQSEFPDVRRREWTLRIHAPLVDVGEYLERRIREEGRYFHDLETTGLDPKQDTFRCIGISADDKEVFCLDWTPDVIEFVRRLHADPALMCVGQNSESFDIMFQEEKGFTFNGPTYDTMLGHHLLNPGLPKDLETLGATHTDEPHWKDSTMYKAGEDALQTGCGKDVHATARAFYDQITEIDSIPGYRELYFNQIMPLQPVLRRMTRRGVKKDINVAAAWHSVLSRRANELEVRLKKGLGDHSFNVNSPHQLKDLLYRRMGLPVQYKQTREGFIPTVDADALDALALVTKNPIFLLVRSIRTLRKWDSTYVCCDHDDQYFVHGHFSSGKAANGRLNAFDPNMQNFPLEMRVIIVPDTKDHVLIARDWSQIEWRIAMALSGDRAGLDALAAGRDAHSDAYSRAFNVPYDGVTKKDRFEAKTYNYGMLYGRGEESLSKGRPGHPDSAIPIDRVHEYFLGFYSTYTGYKQFRDKIQQDVLRQHFVTTAWGRRRYWYTRGQMPEAFNYPISGTAAHMMYEAIVEVENQLPKGAELRMTVHDELVMCCVKEQKILKQALECSQDVMERRFVQIEEASLYPDVVREYFPNGWHCPSDVHIGENWKITKGDNKEDLAIEAELRKRLGV